MLFRDRREAGQRLADRLARLHYPDPVVLALPRGGVPVGYEVARALHAPLDLVLVRKIGAPGQEELAIAAVADGEVPELVTDPGSIRSLRVTPAYLERATQAALSELSRRRQAYLGDHPAEPLAGRTGIIVDDGIATGATTLAAIRATRHRKPARLVLAVPVAPEPALRRLRDEVDDIVCLDTPDEFWAVGQSYRQFPQLRDETVIELLARARAATASQATRRN